MIIIGLIEILYSVGYGAVQAFGADFTLPPSTTEVISYLTSFPLATSITSLKSSSPLSLIAAPLAISPALKSIQLFFLLYSGELLDILRVGTGEANGVPLPVVNKTI